MQQSLPPLRWQAYEYEHREKSVDWFWALGVIAVTGAVAAIIFENILFAILIVVGAFVLALFAVRKPNLSYFEINPRGVRVDNTLHPYTALDSFWVADMDEYEQPKLIIKSQKLLLPHIIIPIESIPSGDVREFLLLYLEEEEHIEPVYFKIMEHFGF